MARKKKADRTTAPMFDVTLTTAPCVPAIRDKLDDWRARNYEGASDTTRCLLNYWFCTDHRLPDGRKFAYHYSQQRAVETLIYLYEIAKLRRQKSLIETYSARQDLKLLQFDDFARYCVKMATGSGKTKVMALAIAWQYFNAVAEGRDDFANTFLIISPNVIVFERLRADFGGGRIFRLDPVVPDELRIYWDFPCYLRGEAERASSLGALYLTNVQQLHARYQAYLTAGVERWKEYREQLAPMGRKPLLFVMMNDTAEADDVGDWLRRKYPAEFGGKQLLIIHTNRSGGIVQKDLDEAMWCENATMLTGIPRTYLKVRQSDYNSLQPSEFADLVVLPF